MSQKLNCWQFMNCGREEGGLLADILGTCPVSTSMKHDGTNGGKAAGRMCWKVKNSCHDQDSIGTCQTSNCHMCSFYKRVHFDTSDEPVIPLIPVLAEEPELL